MTSGGSGDANIYCGQTIGSDYSTIELSFTPRGLIYQTYYTSDKSTSNDFKGIMLAGRYDYEYALDWYENTHSSIDQEYLGFVMFKQNSIQIVAYNKYYTLDYIVFG